MPTGATLPPAARPCTRPLPTCPSSPPTAIATRQWWAQDTAFPNPAALLIQPDHYVFRMLYSQGVALGDLGIGPGGEGRDPRDVFRLFAQHWDAFLGTPSRQWMEYTLINTLGVEVPLTPDSADAVYDAVAERLATPDFRPRALFDRFGIEALATTDAATDPLDQHAAIAASGWSGRIIPTFRPDDLLNPARPGHAAALDRLATMTRRDVARYPDFLDALRDRRAAFREAWAPRRPITTCRRLSPAGWTATGSKACMPAR